MRLMTESGGERRVRFRYLAVIIGLSLVGPALTVVETGTVDWFWLAVGAVVFGVATGPFAQTATADRIDRLGGEPGSLRKVLVIVVMAISVWSAIEILQPSTVSLNSFVGGGMAALFVVSVGRELRT